MPEKYIRALSRALWDTDLIGVRTLLAIAEMSWAIMLFWPGDTFDRPTYAGMASIAPELVWATVFLLSAATQFTIVILEDFRSAFSRYFAAWNGCLWLVCIASILHSVSPPPAAIGGELALCAGAVWIWFRPFILAEGIKRARASTV